MCSPWRQKVVLVMHIHLWHLKPGMPRRKRSITIFGIDCIYKRTAFKSITQFSLPLGPLEVSRSLHNSHQLQLIPPFCCRFTEWLPHGLCLAQEVARWKAQIIAKKHMLSEHPTVSFCDLLPTDIHSITLIFFWLFTDLHLHTKACFLDLMEL